MNRQDLIKQYRQYGYSNTDISKELGIDLALVELALENIPIKFHKYKKLQDKYEHATDLDHIKFELLYTHGSRKLNKLVKRLGVKLTAEFLGVKKYDIVGLKRYFGYANNIPSDAIEQLTYFSTEMRREIDERDNRVCTRCGYDCSTDYIRYHKLTQPGPMVIDNAVTLCHFCKLKHVNPKRDIFKDMTPTEFHEWFQKYDVFKPHRGQPRLTHRQSSDEKGD